MLVQDSGHQGSFRLLGPQLYRPVALAELCSVQSMLVTRNHDPPTTGYVAVCQRKQATSKSLHTQCRGAGVQSLVEELDPMFCN